MRGALAAEAGKLAGRSPAEILALVRRLSGSDQPIIDALVEAGIDGDKAILAAAKVTGLPPAPRLLLRNPQIPAHVDVIGVRDAGGIPVGLVQGRAWVAFTDPEAAKAAIFSDDVVVCLALDEDLAAARAHFEAEHPASEAGDTQAIAAITPEQIAAWKKQRDQETGAGLSPPSRVTSSRPAAPGLVDPPTATGIVADVMITADDDGSGSIAKVVDPERLRLLRAAQMGRLKRFQFDRAIGSGGMATVYLARDREHPGPPLAVKLLEPQLIDNTLAVARFRREVRALMSLQHPHIVAPVDGDAEADGGVLWLACRYLDGGTLHDLMRRTGALPVHAALPMVAALFEGLKHAHGVGIVHRDLKPHNVLLDHDGSLCIADFGVARAVGDAPLTQAGARFGTPAYMSPEQAKGGDIDARSDLFSVGVILYEMLSGTNPFVRASRIETMRAVAEGDVADLPPVVRVPMALRRLLSALLSPVRDARPPSADSVLQTLRPMMSTLPPVDDVIRRLLINPVAFHGLAPLTNDDTVAEDGAIDGSTATADADVDVDDNHSAFGDVVGAKATMELPRIQIEALKARRADETETFSTAELAALAAAPAPASTSTSLPPLATATVAAADVAPAIVPHVGVPAPSAAAQADGADEDDDFDALRRRQRRPIWIALVVFVIVVVTGLTVMWWATRIDETDGPGQPGTSKPGGTQVSRMQR